MNVKLILLTMIQYLVKGIFLLQSVAIFICISIYRLTLKWKGCASKHHHNPFISTHPDVFKHKSQIIHLAGYHITEYEFPTPDNAYVSFWRVQKQSSGQEKTNQSQNDQATSRQVVLIQHGLLDCSMTWFLHSDKQKCLPYMLAAQNYDVWVGNNRGTKYSDRNSHLPNYWDYNLDHLVQYDMPTLIQSVLQQTKTDKITYIGHSQGTTQFLTALGTHTYLKDHIKTFIGLGTIISINHLNDHPILHLGSKLRVIKLLKWIGFKAILLIPTWMSRIVGMFIYNIPIVLNLFYQVVIQLCGKTDNNNLDLDRFGVIITHQPGGASVNNLLQWFQFYEQKKTSKFNYGKKKNKEIYGSQQPPQYCFKHLSELPFHSHLFIGKKDRVISEDDFKLLAKNIQSSGLTVYELDDYAHLDYIWGINAHKDIYHTIINILNRKSKQQLGIFSTDGSEDVQ